MKETCPVRGAIRRLKWDLQKNSWMIQFLIHWVQTQKEKYISLSWPLPKILPCNLIKMENKIDFRFNKTSWRNSPSILGNYLLFWRCISLFRILPCNHIILPVVSVALLKQRGWTNWPPESLPTSSILCFCAMIQTILQWSVLHLTYFMWTFMY